MLAQIPHWAKNLYTYALAHVAAWQIPSPQTTIKPLLDAYESACASLSCKLLVASYKFLPTNRLQLARRYA